MLHLSSRQHDGVGQEQPPKNERRKSNGKAPKRRSSALRFFASNTSPKNESSHQAQKDWEAQYLKDLRGNRPARPGGSRPLPVRNNATPEPNIRVASALSMRPAANDGQEHLKPNLQERAVSSLSHRRTESELPRMTLRGSFGGRPLVQTPDLAPQTRQVSGSSTSPTSQNDMSPIAYRESGMRWMEKQEARALRDAMQEMELREEAKVHAAAQDEASQLILQHIAKGVAPEIVQSGRNYREHLREGSHARSWSQGWSKLPSEAPAIKNSAMKPPKTQILKHSSNYSPAEEAPENAASNQSGSDDTVVNAQPRTHIRWDSPEKKTYTSLAFNAPTIGTGRRRSSGNKWRQSGGGPFNNPDDKIYEDTEDMRQAQNAEQAAASRIPRPLSAKATDTAVNTSIPKRTFIPSMKVPGLASSRTHRTEIHRNPPSQSRNAAYTQNERPRSNEQHQASVDMPAVNDANLTEGTEIRSDEIRAATSRRMKDRSPKLPTPSFVSDKPGRHIVSFDADWKPEGDRKVHQRTKPENPSEAIAQPTHSRMPASSRSAPAVPTISVSTGSPPSAGHQHHEPKGPRFQAPSEPDHQHSMPANRPLPHHSSTTPVFSTKTHWSLASRRGTAQCSTCALPIAGRIVSAASERFHPECFRCFHCSEALECVAFYPEPDIKRTERLSRIRARLDGGDHLDEKPGETAADDGDESMRFFCHLDYHELYSPRCRSCKTPIETEVVVACGGTWHVGHFFCAECGDPFDPQTPFVEKDGYAWCVKCHAGQFSGKCKGCRKPVVEQGVSALGAEWHESCFVCAQCRHPFEDGRFFTREDDQKPVCVRCEEIRLKA